jgi:hypothetical protein
MNIDEHNKISWMPGPKIKEGMLDWGFGVSLRHSWLRFAALGFVEFAPELEIFREGKYL